MLGTQVHLHGIGGEIWTAIHKRFLGKVGSCMRSVAGPVSICFKGVEFFDNWGMNHE